MAIYKPRSVGYLPPLLNFLQQEPSPKGRGRPHKLVGIYYGRLLIAITKISVKNRKDVSDLSIARKLKKRPEYSRLSLRQLRRDVGAIISDLIDTLKECPRSTWLDRFGVSPPREMTKRSLRQKAFEFLWRPVKN